MDASLRPTQQGRPATASYRGQNLTTQVVQDSLMSQSVQSSGPIAWNPSQTIILVYNQTGNVLKQFTAVGLGLPVNLPSVSLNSFNHRIILKAATNASTYGVCIDAIPNNCAGRVVVSGVVQATGDVPGATVLWTDGNTGGYRIVQLGVGWSGRVIFANLRNGNRVQATGAVTGFVKIYRDSGVALYDDGSSLANWPEGTEIYDISQLPPGDLIIH